MTRKTSYVRTSSTAVNRDTGRRRNVLPAWIILIGIFIPYVPFNIGGLIFTPARLLLCAFLAPALRELMRPGRSWVASDLCAIATATWMILASALNGGYQAYVGAEAIEFLGAYFVGRANFSGVDGLGLFVRIMKAVTLFLVFLGLLDSLAGRAVTLPLFGITQVQSDYRFGIYRATSTFSNAELFGTFCLALTALFVYSERRVISRMTYAGVSILGVIISLSSGPLLSLAVGGAIFVYDRIFNKVVWRWKLLATVAVVLVILANFLSNDPIPFLIRHFTFDPQTGDFRIATWNFGLAQVMLHPFVGRGFVSFAADSAMVQLFLGQSVDSLWLLLMIRYGVPIIIFLLLTIFLPFFQTTRTLPGSYIARMRMGLNLAIMLMVITALTVHFWDATWIFFSLCIGIRASIVEFEIKSHLAEQRSRPRRITKASDEQVLRPE